MQRRSFWQSVDLWMNDLHEELELTEDSRCRTTTTGSHVTGTEASSYELEVNPSPVGSRCGVRSLSLIPYRLTWIALQKHACGV